MTTLYLYRKTHRRQPVSLRQRFPFRDIQADAPAGWCACCGSEIFLAGQQLCQWCQKTKGDKR